MPFLKEKIIYIAIALLLVGGIALYVFEFYYFQRTFELKPLLLIPAALGVALGAGLGWKLSRDAEDGVEQIQVYLLCIVLSALFLPLLASLSNRLLSPHPVVWEDVVFFEEKAYVSDRFGIIGGEPAKPRGYYLFILRKGKLERIDNRHSMSPAPERGEIILIPVRKGLWGASWVLSDKRPWTGITR